MNGMIFPFRLGGIRLNKDIATNVKACDVGLYTHRYTI